MALAAVAEVAAAVAVAAAAAVAVAVVAVAVEASAKQPRKGTCQAVAEHTCLTCSGSRLLYIQLKGFVLRGLSWFAHLMHFAAALSTSRSLFFWRCSALAAMCFLACALH